MKMFLLLVLSCEVMRRAGPAAAATTVLTGAGGDGIDSATDSSLMTLFIKNILNLGLGAIPGSADRPEPAPAPAPAPLEPRTRTCDKNIVRAFVDVKVRELRPFLQDNDYVEAEPEESAPARAGDTTIVELAPDDAEALRPRRPSKESVRRYRRLRKRIHRALLRETVSNTTVNLIIQTIDELIENMAAGRCRGALGAAQRSGVRAEPPPRAERDVAMRPAAWKLEWQKIREKYSDLFQGNDSVPQERLNEIVGSLMEKLPSFFANVVRDGESLAEGYSVRCEQTAQSSTPGQRSRALARNVSAAAPPCASTTWLCSGELRRFLVHLFKAVNASSARVLHDYLAMYKIDVNIDRVLGHKGIVATLRDINREAEGEVCKIYAQKIQSLAIKKGKEHALHRTDLIDLIQNLTENVKLHTNQIIRVRMEPIDTELKERILKDLDDNMKVELDRLAGEAEHTICTAFATCNGRYTVRRARGAGAAPRGGVFVRVQLQLDEEPAVRARADNYTRLSDTPMQMKYSTFDRKNYNKKLLNVTRTTTFYSGNDNTQID